jgi:hypothetical protein
MSALTAKVVTHARRENEKQFCWGIGPCGSAERVAESSL